MAEFWRVKRGQWPLSDNELRVQLRQKRVVGSVMLDEHRVYVGMLSPAFAVERGKRIIRRRRAEQNDFAAVLGDTPAD